MFLNHQKPDQAEKEGGIINYIVHVTSGLLHGLALIFTVNLLQLRIQRVETMFLQRVV